MSAPLLFEPLARERRGKPLFWGVTFTVPHERLQAWLSHTRAGFRELGMPEAQFTRIRFIGGSVNRGPTLLRGAGAATTPYVYRTWALCFACVVLEPCR